MFAKQACAVLSVASCSILGPLLFLIYVNDLHKASSILKPVMFADDTNLVLSNKDINKLFNVTAKNVNLV